MKRLIIWTWGWLLLAVTFSSCEKVINYPGGQESSIIAVADVRSLYKGDAVTLTKDNMFGATQIVGMVISDHSAHNLPSNLLIVQNFRRFKLRGIAIDLGSDAANYQAGDSVHIYVEGASLDRVDGTLQLKGVSPDDIQVVSSGNTVTGVRVPNNELLAHPFDYESTLVAIVKGGFNPIPDPAETYAGVKFVNDGFGDVALYTESNASFAHAVVPVNANFTGIVYVNQVEGQWAPEHRMRSVDDVQVLSSEIKKTPIVIAGFLNDAIGTDANYEYIQLLATEDIDFSETPFSVVTTNNAGASTPQGLPTKGWATGGLRTYKFDLTAGFAAKGTYFYVGGTPKKINGANSNSIAEANWIVSYGYNSLPGFGFGQKTSNLLANSGNAFGISVFEGTDVTATSVPVDVIFISGGGSLFSEGPPAVGYKITNTDFYDIVDPISLMEQPFYRMGNNTLYFSYPTANYFTLLGGEYNTTLGRWTQARSQTNIELPNESTLSMIEGEEATAKTTWSE